jgi:hypothetical protein
LKKFGTAEETAVGRVGSVGWVFELMGLKNLNV